MRGTIIPSIVLTVGLAACGPAHPTDTTFPAPARLGPPMSTQQDVLLPVSGKCEAAMEAPIFVSPGVIRQVDAGSCEISHLGRVSFHSAKVINVIAGTQVTEASFTAANGDSIYMTGSGTNTPGTNGLVTFSTTLTFVRGTGRFENVEGGASVVGEANLVTRKTTLTLEGTISYAASDSRRP